MATATADQLIAAAKEHLGRPWVLGKADCVVLVKQAYASVGVTFPKTDSGGRPTTVSNLFNRFRGTKLPAIAANVPPKKGNLLIFVNPQGKMAHVAIAIDDTHMIGAILPAVEITRIDALSGPHALHLKYILQDPNIIS
jgi:cell wall-associated NlpC family hydrolase